jgi:nitrogen fixation protein FixH
MSAKGVLRPGHVLAILLGSFAVVFAVNAYFVVMAVASFPGEEEAKSYAQGLRFNDTLRDRQAQAALRWRAAADLTKGGGNAAVVELALRDASDHPLGDLTIAGALRRPTDAALDRPVTFKAGEDGRYRAALPGLPAGQWELEVRAVRGAQHLDINKRLIWRPRTSS